MKNDTAPLKAIRRQVERFGTKAEVARRLGIAEGHLHDILTGRRLPGPRLLARLGFSRTVERRVVYKYRGKAWFTENGEGQ